MIEFAWPWLFLLLPLPWLCRRFLPPAPPTQEAALRVPFMENFELGASPPRFRSAKKWPLWIASLAWLLLVAACARPQWLGDPIQQRISGRDLMLAVDLSGSMEVDDFVLHGQRVDRLTATKAVASQFIEQRASDRLGLILFGERAYLQAPLTFDRKTIQTYLDEAVIGLAGDKTAIGDAIGLAVKRLRQTTSEHRILILLTDGANTAGEVSPIKAAELAASEGLKIYTIGIGADEMMIRGYFFSRRINPTADLDEATLRAIAEKTGGRYFRARDTQELAGIYDLLDALEPVEKDQQAFRPRIELYIWPLAAALLLAGCLTVAKLKG